MSRQKKTKEEKYVSEGIMSLSDMLKVLETTDPQKPDWIDELDPVIPSVVELTPENAIQLIKWHTHLDNDSNNKAQFREIDHRLAREYALDILYGRFRSHTLLELCDDGRILDGQTRIIATAYSCKPFTFLVVRGRTPADKTKTDVGRKRNLVQGLKYTHKFASNRAQNLSILSTAEHYLNRGVVEIIYTNVSSSSSEIYQRNEIVEKMMDEMTRFLEVVETSSIRIPHTGKVKSLFWYIKRLHGFEVAKNYWLWCNENSVVSGIMAKCLLGKKKITRKEVINFFVRMWPSFILDEPEDSLRPIRLFDSVPDLSILKRDYSKADQKKAEAEAEAVEVA